MVDLENTPLNLRTWLNRATLWTNRVARILSVHWARLLSQSKYTSRLALGSVLVVSFYIVPWAVEEASTWLAVRTQVFTQVASDLAGFTSTARNLGFENFGSASNRLSDLTESVSELDLHRRAESISSYCDWLKDHGLEIQIASAILGFLTALWVVVVPRSLYIQRRNAANRTMTTLGPFLALHLLWRSPHGQCQLYQGLSAGPFRHFTNALKSANRFSHTEPLEIISPELFLLFGGKALKTITQVPSDDPAIKQLQNAVQHLEEFREAVQGYKGPLEIYLPDHADPTVQRALRARGQWTYQLLPWFPRQRYRFRSWRRERLKFLERTRAFSRLVPKLPPVADVPNGKLQLEAEGRERLDECLRRALRGLIRERSQKGLQTKIRRLPGIPLVRVVLFREDVMAQILPDDRVGFTSEIALFKIAHVPPTHARTTAMPAGAAAGPIAPEDEQFGRGADGPEFGGMNNPGPDGYPSTGTLEDWEKNFYNLLTCLKRLEQVAESDF